MLREFEAALKAAGDPTRTRILKLLEAGPLCVCQVQAVLGLAPSTVSKHLTLLRAAGLVNDRRDGRWIHYALAAEERNPYARAVLALLRGSLAEGEALLFVYPRASVSATTIHMLFMRFPIAVVWLDGDRVVVDAKLAKPWRLVYAPRRAARYVIEARPELLGRVAVGDRLEWEEPAGR
mgnify:CR=1 FL=1